MQKFSSKQKYSAAGVIILAILAGFLLSKNSSSATQDKVKAQAVKTILTEEADMDIPLEISGFVRGENRADVSPMTSGRILRIFKHEGQSVKKGEILATIDSSQSDAQVSAAAANVDALQKTLTESKKYYDQLVSQSKEAPASGATSEAIKSVKRGRDLQIQAAKDQLIAAQGALTISEASRKNSTVIAPFSGTITTINAHEGENANFSMPFITISTPSSKEIETFVSATNSRNIKVGMIATMQTSNGQPVSGTVTAVSSGSDTQSLKTLVRIRIDDISNNVYLGDFLHGEILIQKVSNAISIPRSAVISRGGDQIVFTIDEKNIAKEQTIKTSSEYNGMIIISEGITKNQKIVTEGQQYLINGSITKPYESN